jgi:DHA2 family multidrug resistance protein
MEVPDSSIANVALPHIAGSLGASEDEATWVRTSYLVSNAIILPASAYLTTFIGRKKFYMICVVLFGLSGAGHRSDPAAFGRRPGALRLEA